MRAKEFSFPASVEWLGDTRVATRINGKREIETSSPPEFRGKDATIWSPEDFFVGAAASCPGGHTRGHRRAPRPTTTWARGERRRGGRPTRRRRLRLYALEPPGGHQDRRRPGRARAGGGSEGQGGLPGHCLARSSDRARSRGRDGAGSR